MRQDWLTLQAYVARPGAERNLLQSGVRTAAIVDTGSAITIVPNELVQRVYGTEKPPIAGVAHVIGVAGTPVDLQAIPFLVGLSVGNRRLVHAQVECLVGATDCMCLGRDVLSLLGLELRIDYHQRRVHLEQYTWERFEDEVAAIYRLIGASVKRNLGRESAFSLNASSTVTK
jgi:hypothetical protein